MAALKHFEKKMCSQSSYSIVITGTGAFSCTLTLPSISRKRRITDGKELKFNVRITLNFTEEKVSLVCFHLFISKDGTMILACPYHLSRINFLRNGHNSSIFVVFKITNNVNMDTMRNSALGCKIIEASEL